MLVAAPVGPGGAHQLKRRGVDLPGVLDVRAAAQVGEFVVDVQRDLRLALQRAPIFIEIALLQASDQLQLVGLILERLARLLSRDHFALELVPPGDDLAHALLEGL